MNEYRGVSVISASEKHPIDVDFNEGRMNDFVMARK